MRQPGSNSTHIWWRCLVFAVLTGLSALPSLHARPALLTARETRLYRQLEKIPPDIANYPRIKNLVRHLVQIDPRHAPSFFTLAVRLLPYPDGEPEWHRLALAVSKIVKRSTLPRSFQEKIFKQIVAATIFDVFAYPVYPAPTPTPSPSPTP